MERKIIEEIKEKLEIDLSQVQLRIDKEDIAYLTGEVETWEDVVNIGYFVAKKKKIRNVVNDLQPRIGKVPKRDRSEGKRLGESKGIIDKVDVVIIGAGVVGCGIARELSRFNLKIAVIEKESDVSDGTSKANDGMIHPGNAVKPFTLKAKLNVEGNKMYSNWAKELNFEFKRTGSIILSYSKKDRKGLRFAYIAGRLNKVPKMRLVGGSTAMRIEPSITKKPKVALWTPTTAYVDGFEVTIALAENAASNGVKFYLETEACDIRTKEGEITGVITNRGIIECDCVINAAGVYSDEIAEMVGDRFYTIHPRKGTILILDKRVKGPSINVAISKEIKNKNTKGGGGLRTVSGNPLWGPSAKEVADKEDVSVDKEAFDYAFKVGKEAFNQASKKDVIAFFTGIRAPDYKEDFIIEESKKVKGFIHSGAIQSPGLASAPAIAKMVVDITLNYYRKKDRTINKRESFNPIRKALTRFNKLTRQEQHQLIMKDSRYGNIICRCETVTEGEIIEALHRPLPCTTVEGIKKRTRATAGRCQGGFCTPKILTIIARELNKDITEITQKGSNSNIILKRARDIKVKGAGVNEDN